MAAQKVWFEVATASFEDYEHNVGNLAIEIVGQNWSGEVISLFLQDWEVGRVALAAICLWTFCAKK